MKMVDLELKSANGQLLFSLNVPGELEFYNETSLTLKVGLNLK